MSARTGLAMFAIGLLWLAGGATTAGGQEPAFHHLHGGDIFDVFFLDESRGWTAKELKESHGKMQERWNKPDIAAIAFGCNCPAPWTPGPGYANCPTMGSPPGGCAGTASDDYPDNNVIPDCSSSCPENC